MRTTSILAVITAAAVMLTACANQKEPAEKAVAKVEASLSEIKADAEKFAATELKETEEAIGRLKAKLTSQDYSGALQGAPSVASSVRTLKENVAQRKKDAEELAAAAQQEWAELSTSVPATVQKLQARVDSLNRARRTPQGLDKAAWETAKADFEKIKTSWAEATAEFGAGQAADAVRRARSAKNKAEYLVQKLGA